VGADSAGGPHAFALAPLVGPPADPRFRGAPLDGGRAPVGGSAGGRALPPPCHPL